MTHIGIVLSSGGSRGVFAHTGFMEALRDLGVEIAASSGCSAGAVVGGVIASGTDLDEWASAVSRIRTAQFWKPISTPILLYKLLVERGCGLTGISDTSAAIHFIHNQLRAKRFEDCIYPFSSIAVDLATVEKLIFSTGPLAPAIMASAAIPGLYAPVDIQGRLYCDGAIYEFAPAEAICCKYSLDVVIVHHVQHQDFTQAGLDSAFRQPWTMISILQRLISRTRPWYTTGNSISVSSCPCGCKAVIVVVEPVLPAQPWSIKDGGQGVLVAARRHAVDNLGPLLDRLQVSPRTLLKT